MPIAGQNGLLRQQLGQRDEELSLLRRDVHRLEGRQADWRAQVEALTAELVAARAEQQRLFYSILTRPDAAQMKEYFTTVRV